MSFPPFFSLCNSKEAWVADLWQDTPCSGMRTPTFSRAPNDGELKPMERSLAILQAKRMDTGSEDLVFW